MATLQYGAGLTSESRVHRWLGYRKKAMQQDSEGAAGSIAEQNPPLPDYLSKEVTTFEIVTTP